MRAQARSRGERRTPPEHRLSGSVPHSVVDVSGYSALVAHGLLREAPEIAERVAPAHRFAIITDDTVRPLYGDQLVEAFAGRAWLFSVPAGEHQKTRDSWSTLTDELLAAGFGRDTTIIALGGGVVGDLAGFVAATFMRGIPVVQIPTTLLAMIDAAIGGKTGVDVPGGKNLVGAIHPPAAVVVDLDALGTLPLRHWRAGLAEAIKHGVIGDAAYFESIDSALPVLAAQGGSSSADVEPLVTRSIEIKSSVVRADLRERGPRHVLNFGHTLGHAIEAASGYDLLHGEAIAIGMVLESEVAERASIAQRGTAQRIRDVLIRAGLPVLLPANVDAERVMAIARGDKKVRAGVTRYALPTRIGAMAGERQGWTLEVADTIVREVIASHA